MKIGIVTTWFERGAAYVSRQYKELLETEHEVFIFARAGEEYAIGDPNWDSEKVTWANRDIADAAKFRFNLNEFSAWIKTNSLDLVFFNEQHWWPPIKVCRDLGVRVGSYIDYYTETLIPFYRLYDFLICNTQKHMDAFDWHPQAHYIPWGTNSQVFMPAAVDKAAEDNLVFFHSGGMSPTNRKGTQYVIEAFDHVAHYPCKLLLHCQVDLYEHLNSKQSEILRRLVSEKKIELVTETIPAPGLYHRADVYVYPTKLEGIGLTVMEAQSCGLPTIVPDNGPMNEFLSPETGRLVKIDHYYCRKDAYYWPMCVVDISDLAEQMKYYLENSDALPELKRKTRTFALENLDWYKRKEEVLNVFTSVRKLEVDYNDYPKLLLMDEWSVRVILSHVKAYLKKLLVRR